MIWIHELKRALLTFNSTFFRDDMTARRVRMDYPTRAKGVCRSSGSELDERALKIASRPSCGQCDVM